MLFFIEKIISIFSQPCFALFYLILFCDCFGLFNASGKPWALEMIPSATELNEAGIKFQKKEFPKEFKKAGQLDVSFRTDGLLEIPWFTVDDTTYHSFWNLIALEQHLEELKPSFSSYCRLLDNLIDTAEDVAILRRSGILQNLLGDDSEVAKVFNDLGKRVFLDVQRNSYRNVYTAVTNYCEASHHRWRANLVQKYFSNPWSIFSLLGVVIIIVFTITQTVFTIKP